jgi:hypothetical protein
MSYFHTGIRTIIGAESFHCPVRDGKEWDQLAMVIRHKGLLWCIRVREYTHGEFIEQISFWFSLIASLGTTTLFIVLTVVSTVKVIGSSRTSN